MLMFGGLWAGGILIFAVERCNLWRRMSLSEYTVDFRRSLGRVDPLLPILGVLASAGAAAFAAGAAGRAAALAWSGFGLVLLVIVASIAIAEPINSKFRRLPEGTPPPGAERYRTLWRRFHTGRTVVALAAFACLAGAASH